MLQKIVARFAPLILLEVSKKESVCVNRVILTMEFNQHVNPVTFFAAHA
jgi:hypothetical protein